jgi:regulator of replication initiation timing
LVAKEKKDKDRIAKLEALLERSSQEKDEMRSQILELVAEVAQLRTEIKYLTDKRIGSI